MKKTKSNYVYLDATRIKHKFSKRFPNIYKKCLSIGIDPEKDYIPVAPASHYTMGGIKTDIWGRTNLSSLYACGECTSTGVHGANRLASNSLLEGLVFGKRIAQIIAQEGDSVFSKKLEGLKLFYRLSRKKEKDYNPSKLKKELQNLMWNKVGIIRNSKGLIEAKKKIKEWEALVLASELTNPQEFELANLIILAELVANSALQRKESRGAHYRLDFPNRNDQRWRKHIEY